MAGDVLTPTNAVGAFDNLKKRKKMKYRCPKCERDLNMKGGVILIGECGDRKTGFVFDPKPGEYRLSVADEEEVEPGTTWEFTCPLCSKNLTTSFNKRLAEIQMVDGDITKQVLFSKIASHKATFVLGGEEMEVHGDDARIYMN